MEDRRMVRLPVSGFWEPEDRMRRVMGILGVVVVLGTVACRYEEKQIWFEGDLESARAEAAARGTLATVEFNTDWCSWCRRLESDTFSDPDVQQELSGLVAMKEDAEKGGLELARKFGVDSYPTMVFLDPDGNEMERILGYLPPEKFLRRVQRIRVGDTFLACLRKLEEDPGDRDAIERSVAGLLERSDPEGAISRIEAFHQVTDGQQTDVWRKLMFTARAELQSRVYQRAATLYRRGWDRAFEVPDTAGTRRLHALVKEGLTDREVEEQAMLLREARYEDAGELLQIPDFEAIPPSGLLEVADFAFRNGHFDLSSELYLKWYGSEEGTAAASALNDVAWRLYLSRQKLEIATEIARSSYDRKADPEAADTLARLLYVTGNTEQAIAMEEMAAETAEKSRGEVFQAVAERMADGETLDDRPTFETYPGKRRRVL